MLLAVASAILALCVGNPMARAEGPGHSGEGGKAKPGGESGTHEGTENHGESHEGRRMPPSDIPHEGGVSIFGGTEKRPDGWRYRHEHDSWWYWSPKNHWMYYENGKWSDYGEDDSSAEIPVQSDPNYYWHHGHWWYLRDNHWSYFDNGRWGDGPAGMEPPRRDEHHGETKKKDEHSPHPEEHSATKK
jgi:hypothetical protein